MSSQSCPEDPRDKGTYLLVMGYYKDTVMGVYAAHSVMLSCHWLTG